MLNVNNPGKEEFGSGHFQARPRGRQQDTVSDAHRRGIPHTFSFVNMEYNTGS